MLVFVLIVCTVWNEIIVEQNWAEIEAFGLGVKIRSISNIRRKKTF